MIMCNHVVSAVLGLPRLVLEYILVTWADFSEPRAGPETSDVMDRQLTCDDNH